MLDNEKLLIKRAKAGEAQSFGLLYDHYAKPIYRFVFLKVSHKEEAEDLMHEVFISAWQNIGNYDDRGFPFSSWLYQIARNRVIDYYRTRKEMVPIDKVDESFFKIASAVEQNIDRHSSLLKVKKALTQLNEEQQNVIILRFIEDLNPAEIANILGKSEGAVRLVQHRAIQKLKNIIEHE